MATYYVDSNATGTNAGTSWTDAWTSFWSLPTLASADIVYVASNHVEGSVAANRTLTGPAIGEAAYIYSATSGTTTYAVGAQVKTTGGTYTLTLDGAFYVAGVTFESGSAAASAVNLLADGNEFGKLLDCTFKGGSSFGVALGNYTVIACTFDYSNDSASAGNGLITGTNQIGFKTKLIDCQFINATNRTGSNARLVGSWAAGRFEFEGCDFSSIPSVCEFGNGGNLYSDTTYTNCTMPATWTALASQIQDAAYQEFYNCENADSASERIAFIGEYLAGTITYDKTVYMTDGNSVASDDGTGATQAFSWKMESEDTALEVSRVKPLVTPWIYFWVASTGSKNLDLYVGATETLDNGEVWAEYEYMGTAGVEKYSYASTERGPLTAATTYATTGGTWNATVTEEYYLRSTVTINEIGLVRARVAVGATSKTIYVNPKIIVS